MKSYMMSREKEGSPHEEYLRKVLEREERLSREIVEEGVFEADPDGRPKILVTFPYPYMNGSLHLGHAYTSGRLDVYARYKRLKGFNVLYPWAWHWTGEAVYGTVHRLRMGDQSVISRLVDLDGVDPEDLEKLQDPVYFVKYFTEKNRRVVKRYGLSIDWRREFHTTSLHELYNKFVEWQIRQLYNKGYIVQGSHPVVWCPVDQSPTGDHDRLEGEGVRPEEYYLIKFRLGDAYIVAGTLRPETIYGVTNIWVNPEAKYVLADVDGEKWIVSSDAAYKLQNQLKRVEVLEEFLGRDLVGKWAEAPLVGRKVPILPAAFVDPTSITGVVYSVPAHAPYDYAALRDVARGVYGEELAAIARDIKPIQVLVIRGKGFGQFPAVEIVERMGIESQNDPRLEKATKEIYHQEYVNGYMLEDNRFVGGLPTGEAREKTFEILRDMGLADKMYDLPEPVICRCTARCIVKILPDQWFLKYSDPRWKRQAHRAVDDMSCFPEEVRSLLHHYIDWYEDWPCTRRSGLGTPFPFDREWIVETLTDSTIYPAFYTVAKFYNQGLLKADRVGDEFFNYVFLGMGNVDHVSESSGVDREVLERIREEFLYWYPVDLRGSGKDLISNHLTFYVFHHVAIFPRDKWPRGITANGFTRLNGRPMSKSSGNYISMEKAIETVSADALRLSILMTVDGLEDPDWRGSSGYAALQKMQRIERLVERVVGLEEGGGDEFFDTWLRSKFSKIVNEVEEALEKMEVARAARAIFNELLNSIEKYMAIATHPNKGLIRSVVTDFVKLISMYTPFLAQYLWRDVLGMDGYVYFSEYPRGWEIDEKSLLIDGYLEEVVRDIKELVRVLGGAREIHVVVAGEELWSVFSEAADQELDGARRIIRSRLGDGKVLGSVMKFVSREWYGRRVKYLGLLKSLSAEEEYNVLRSLLPRYLKAHGLDVTVKVYREGEELAVDVKSRKMAFPLYPAIYVA